jgi:hypothetical protein
MSLDFPAFALTEERQELRAAVRALADDKIAPRAAEVDESGEFSAACKCFASDVAMEVHHGRGPRRCTVSVMNLQCLVDA